MKNILKSAALAATLLVGATAAHADQTITGAVGLPLNPTAQIPERGGIRLQGSYFDLGNDLKFYGVHAAGRIADGLEISGGVSRNSLSGNNNGSDFDKTGIDLGVKYLFTRESDPAKVRLAVGAGYSRALLNNINVYGVASKYINTLSGDRFPLTLHAGIRYDRFRVDTGFGDAKSNKLSAFGGAEVGLTRNNSFSAVGELGSKNADGGKIPYSASVRFRPQGQGFSASVGFARQGLSRDSGFFAQLGYTFSTGSNNTGTDQ